MLEKSIASERKNALKIGVIGSGSWGTALAQVLADNGHDVLIYGVNQAEINDINENHRNSRFFGETKIAESLRATLDVRDLSDYTDAFLLAVPTKFFGDAIEKIKPLLDEKTVIINVAKGFSWDTDERLSVYIRKKFDACRYGGVVSLVGPSHAEEVILRKLTALCAVSQAERSAEIVQELFSNHYIRVYTLNDEIGAEYGVAMKNVIAIASGILEGLGYGDNAKAALITRGLREMVSYGVSKGGREETFIGLTGIGDLIVTCFSPHSRNYRAGLAIGRQNSAKALENSSETVEGVHSCLSIYRDSRALKLEMPIVSAIYAVLYEGKEPSEALSSIMSRPLKKEN